METLRHPLTPLVTISLTMTAAFVGYLILGQAPTERFETLAGSLGSLALAIWITADARRRGITPCYDFGFFCCLTLPIATPWYCFWSRGWRGGLTLLLLAAIWLAPYIVATAVWITFLN